MWLEILVSVESCSVWGWTDAEIREKTPLTGIWAVCSCAPEQSVAATQTPTRCSRNIKILKICFYDYISQESVQASRHRPQPETGEYLGDTIHGKSIYMIYKPCYTIWSTQEPLPVGWLANQLSLPLIFFAMEMIKRWFTH